MTRVTKWVVAVKWMHSRRANFEGRVTVSHPQEDGNQGDRRSGSVKKGRSDSVINFHSCKNNEGSPPQIHSYLCKPEGPSRHQMMMKSEWITCSRRCRR